MQRRKFLCLSALFVGLGPLSFGLQAHHGQITPITYSRAEWRQRLSAAQFNILRDEGTEPAFSSILNKEKRAGVYQCAGCDLPLFYSNNKYNSGTGWPSFHTAINDHIETKPDEGLFYTRTEYHCARCGGHQGHVFEDGPEPTGLRWCNNGLALNFAVDKPS
jgi:peptide-methionine (R)-S-oxide reductase